MAKGTTKNKKTKTASDSKGKKMTLKTAKSCLKSTADGSRCLDLSNQGLSAVPKCILKLCDVEELDLSRNALQKLPAFIDRFTNLRSLDLHSNHLEHIPESIGRLQNLVSLNLCNNRLTSGSLPSELGLLRRLRQLNLGLNRLAVVPSSLSALRELRRVGLFDNQLTRYPEQLRGLPRLERINLDNNPIVDAVERRPRGDADGAVRRAESLYLVKQSCLCEECLQKAQTERQRLESRVSGEAASSSSTGRSRVAFAGLVSPNSVAQLDQETWR